MLQTVKVYFVLTCQNQAFEFYLQPCEQSALPVLLSGVLVNFHFVGVQSVSLDLEVFFALYFYHLSIRG